VRKLQKIFTKKFSYPLRRDICVFLITDKNINVTIDYMELDLTELNYQPS